MNPKNSACGSNSDDPLCMHYKRNVKLFAPCCNKIYRCRICHDEKEEHALNTKLVRSLICMRCDTKQGIGNICTYCDIVFGEAYACLTCRLFDNEFKNQYHCLQCGVCRIGPKDHYFHCKRCNLCLNIHLEDKHKCIDNVSRDACPICLEDLHRSVKPLFLSTCGHIIHNECFQDLVKSGQTQCPICKSKLESKMDKIINLLYSLTF